MSITKKQSDVRTKLILLSSEEFSRKTKNVTKINSLTQIELMKMSQEIEIELKKEYFNPDTKKRKFYVSPLNQKKNRQSYQFAEDFTKNMINDEFNKKIDGSQEKIKLQSINQHVENKDNEDLMTIYTNFLQCLDSKRSVGKSKLNRRNSLEKVGNDEKFKKKNSVSTIPDLNFNDFNKIENVLKFLNRGGTVSHLDLERKKRVKNGIVYLHSLVYCLKIMIKNFQKGQKTKEEFNDIKKSLLSPLFRRCSSKFVSFEVIKKVYIWQEEKKERRESNTNLFMIGADLNKVIQKKLTDTFLSNPKKKINEKHKHSKSLFLSSHQLKEINFSSNQSLKSFQTSESEEKILKNEELPLNNQFMNQLKSKFRNNNEQDEDEKLIENHTSIQYSEIIKNLKCSKNIDEFQIQKIEEDQKTLKNFNYSVSNLNLNSKKNNESPDYSPEQIQSPISVESIISQLDENEMPYIYL